MPKEPEKEMGRMAMDDVRPTLDWLSGAAAPSPGRAGWAELTSCSRHDAPCIHPGERDSFSGSAKSMEV